MPTSRFIYDYTTWSESGTNKVGIKDLEKMEPFHIIIFSHVLEHTHDPINTIKSAKNFLVDYGLVICEVPDARINNIKALLQINQGLNYHVCSFSRRSLHNLLKKSGLQNVNTVYQYKSSYRGIQMSSILGIAQTGNIMENENVPAIIGETFSLIWFFAKKVFFMIF